jgi:hypothetical protein
MMKNITLSADESTIEQARKRAMAEHTTLNDLFRSWPKPQSGFQGAISPPRHSELVSEH